jgi:hypothetical protein
MRRGYLTAAVVLLAEVYLYSRYAELGAQFHYWLHGLLGAALGLSVLSATRLLAHRRPTQDPQPRQPWLTAWAAAGLGHLYSAFPDILFLAAGVVHDHWMDAFALHITIHFIPSPLPTMLAVFLLALASYGLATSQRSGPAAAATAGAALAVAVALPLAAPVPDDIQDLRSDPRLAYHHPGQRAPAPADATTKGHHHERTPPVSSEPPRDVWRVLSLEG